MKEEMIEVEAKSLPEARAQLKSRIPEGQYLLSEQVLSDGKPKTVKAVDETLEAAFANAQSEIPDGATIIEKKQFRPAEKKVICIEAYDEEVARKHVKSLIDKTSRFKSLRLVTPGKKGFLGIGKSPDKYESDVLSQAEVEITFKTRAKISARIGEGCSNWSDLLSVLSGIHDPLSASSLFSLYSYQILFAVIRGKVNDARYFDGIPFRPITKETIEKARRYIDNPPIPPLMSMFNIKLLPDRYVIMSGGNIGRKSIAELDGLIVQVADCLAGRGTFSLADPARICNLAYDAIIHYKDIPIVYYFFALPYFDVVKHTKQISKDEALITVYKGIEGLLLGIYDEIGESGVITDKRVVDKVRELMQ